MNIPVIGSRIPPEPDWSDHALQLGLKEAGTRERRKVAKRPAVLLSSFPLATLRLGANTSLTIIPKPIRCSRQIVALRTLIGLKEEGTRAKTQSRKASCCASFFHSPWGLAAWREPSLTIIPKPIRCSRQIFALRTLIGLKEEGTRAKTHKQFNQRPVAAHHGRHPPVGRDGRPGRQRS